MRTTAYLVLARESLRGHKLRTFLTILGILIGIAAVIVLAAVGVGTRGQILAEFESQAGSFVVVTPQWNQDGRPPLLPGPEDAAALRRGTAAAVVPQTNLRLQLARGGRRYYPNVVGTTADFLRVRKLVVRSGRFLLPLDEQHRGRVCVLGNKTADRLFGVADPVGSVVRLNGERFRVIGVLGTAVGGGLFGMESGGLDEIYIPAATALAISGLDTYFLLYLVPPAPEDTNELMRAAETILAREHGPEAEFGIISTEQVLKSISTLTSILTALLTAVGGLALLVGGVGIMNIMLVTVSERTREIGIRKAVGARRRDIMRQFLAEAVFLCLFGGVLGIGTGILGARLVAALTPVQPDLQWWIFVLAVGFAVAVGLVFGIYPAVRAARLSPIQALGRE